MNNKGFIATSLIYAFFLVFVAVVATVLATYAHNRILIKNINSGVEEDLNKSIENKYVLIKNLIENNDFEDEAESFWTLTNATIANPSFSTYHGSLSVSIAQGNSIISQPINNLEKNHYYYLRYYYFMNGPISGTSKVFLENTTNSSDIADFNLSYVNNEPYINWEMKSNIITLNNDGNYLLKITGTNIGGTFLNFNIDSLMLIDVTDIINAGNSIPNTLNYLNTIDYFSKSKSIPKP